MMTTAASRSQIWPKFRRWSAARLTLFGRYLVRMGSWFIPMIVTAGATAWVSYKYNQKSNAELAAQQQRISDLQAFRTSGAELDQSLGSLSDALVDGRGLEEARSKMRNAISRHIADAVANESALGSGAKEYVAALANLRVAVDAVDRKAIGTGTNLWQKSLNLMQARKKLVLIAQNNVGVAQ